MKYLVYAVCRERDGFGRPVSGCWGHQVRFAALDGLALAYSLAGENPTAPTQSLLLEYARTVEALHERGAVLPLRYGCFQVNESNLLLLIGQNRTVFQAALERVDGCAEMGIRVLLPEASSVAVGEKSPAGSGASYLLGRKACYEAMDGEAARRKQAGEEITGHFAGLFTVCEIEPERRKNDRLVSLYFLIRRSEMSPFRTAFGRLESTWRYPLLMTGPWPPYHFVPRLGNSNPLSGLAAAEGLTQGTGMENGQGRASFSDMRV